MRTTSTLTRLAPFAAASVLAACGLVASGTSTDGGADVPDASLDARPDGTGGSDAASDAPKDGSASDDGADAAEVGCPKGLPGPTLVRVDDYCIDSTEVTNAQFSAFAKAMADAGAPPPPCDWATGSDDYRYYGTWSSGEEQLPAAFVNWCGAYEYCRWAKKRLCGKRGGGPLGSSQNDAKDATKSEWFNACSKGGMQAYPYGTAYSSTACNSGTGKVATVGTYAMCVGGVPGLYDTVGNVLEWQDACQAGGQATDDDCILQGGSFYITWDTEPERRCSTVEIDMYTERRDRWSDVGFRCCANLQQ